MKVSYLNDEFFSRLETSVLHLRANLAGFFGGKHLVKTYGQTVEFADYREYMLGDDIRRIDWNLYSRFEKYFLKLFTDERQMHTQIFLDCSASMGKVTPSKAAYAIGFAAALGFLSVHNMDKLSFRLIKEDIAENPFGTIVGKTVDYLCYKKRQVLLVQVLSPDELDPAYDGRVNLLDAEAGDISDPKNMKMKITRSMRLAYDEAMRDFIGDIKSFCNSRGANFITVSSDQPIEKALFGELLKVGIME